MKFTCSFATNFVQLTLVFSLLSLVAYEEQEILENNVCSYLLSTLLNRVQKLVASCKFQEFEGPSNVRICRPENLLNALVGCCLATGRFQRFHERTRRQRGGKWTTRALKKESIEKAVNDIPTRVCIGVRR